jgi:hypothetical protein
MAVDGHHHVLALADFAGNVLYRCQHQFHHARSSLDARSATSGFVGRSQGYPLVSTEMSLRGCSMFFFL